MGEKIKPAEITWRDEKTPVATQFDDPYFSLSNGVEETRHVFLNGNDLPNRFRESRFHIAELGFGSGLNLLVLLDAWLKTDYREPLYFTSFEAFPMRADDALKTLAATTGMTQAKALIAAGFQEDHSFALNHPRIKAQTILGDARQTLPLWKGQADAWFLDGFSPAKNPELWEPSLMQAVYDHTKEGGSFATYTAAGGVRAALTDAGFEVERIKGFAHKRHMTRGVKR